MTNFNLNMNINCNNFAGPVQAARWHQLGLESCALRTRGLASGSWANKKSHLRTFLTFTTFFEVPDFPVQLGVLLRFIAYLGEGTYAYKTAVNLIGSVKWFSAILDPSSIKVFDAVLVTASLKGLKAQLSRPVHQKLPLTVPLLVKIFSVLNLSDIRQLSCWCAMLLAFFGCFRLSNLVPTSASKFDELKHLKRNDIMFDKNVVLVYYKWSKTNQNASKVSWIPICAVSDKRFNLKFYLEKLFLSVKANDNAPLFSFGKRSFHTRYSLVRLLDMCVESIGLSPSDYSWHSFRRGAAMFAFEMGLADSAVQLFGDWSSAAFKTYLEFAYSEKFLVSETIAKSFEKHVNSC